jgi:hypothetical protein
MDCQLRGELAFVTAGAHGIGEANREPKDNTRVAEKRYKELGGEITVLVAEGEGHFPVSRKDPKPVVDFILSRQG